MFNTFQLEKHLNIVYRLPQVCYVQLEQFSVSTMMPKEVNFVEVLVHYNGLNPPSVVNFPYILYWTFWGHAMKGVITCDT